MKIEELNSRLRGKLHEIERFKKEDLPDIIGKSAVSHYRESFVNEGFTDEALEKWPDVKRRDPASPWYGFSLGANTARPGKKSNTKAVTNFSPARTKDKILTGETLELQNSISYEKKSDRVTIRSDKPYSKIHNDGGLAKVFGKTTFEMKMRRFIGRSEVLNSKIKEKINKQLKQILDL